MHTNAENPSCLLYGPLDARFEHQPYVELTDPHGVIIHITYTKIYGSDMSIPTTEQTNNDNKD